MGKTSLSELLPGSFDTSSFNNLLDQFDTEENSLGQLIGDEVADPSEQLMNFESGAAFELSRSYREENDSEEFSHVMIGEVDYIPTDYGQSGSVVAATDGILPSMEFSYVEPDEVGYFPEKQLPLLQLATSGQAGPRSPAQVGSDVSDTYDDEELLSKEQQKTLKMIITGPRFFQKVPSDSTQSESAVAKTSATM